MSREQELVRLEKLLCDSQAVFDEAYEDMMRSMRRLQAARCHSDRIQRRMDRIWARMCGVSHPPEPAFGEESSPVVPAPEVSRERLFVRVWNRLAADSRVDSIGSAEYRRVRLEWMVADMPEEMEAFIIRATRCPPLDGPAGPYIA